MRFVIAAAVVAVLASGVRAEDHKGRIKTVDAEKNSVVVTIEDKDQTFSIPKEAKIQSVKAGKKNEAKGATDIAEGLRGVKEGSQVTVVTEDRDGKSVVVALKVQVEKKKKKKDGK